MTRLLIACDKFKGSLTSAGVVSAIRAGIVAVLPDAEIVAIPVSDGGDGLLDVAVDAGYTRVEVSASGPTGRRVHTGYAVDPPGPGRVGGRDPGGNDGAGPIAGWVDGAGLIAREHRVVVELADACGWRRLPQGTPAPMTASSAGIGEVLAAAVRREAPSDVVLGLGGSASTDGGAGFLSALGARILDARGRPIGPGGVGLETVAALDLSGVIPLPAVQVACDVAAPLTGAQGSAALFGPQKGAKPHEVRRLETALTRWADLVAETAGTDLRDLAGAGAAGGVGFAAATLGAWLQPGAALALDLVGFDAALDKVDLVITGEGCLDAGSLLGKVPVEVARQTHRRGIPVIGLCGREELSPQAAQRAGFTQVHALADLEPDPQRCVRDAHRLLAALTSAAIGAWAGRSGGRPHG